MGQQLALNIPPPLSKMVQLYSWVVCVVNVCDVDVVCRCVCDVWRSDVALVVVMVTVVPSWRCFVAVILVVDYYCVIVM